MSFWYLATPYSKKDRDRAFEEAAQATAYFMARDLPVFSPICHTHPVDKYGTKYLKGRSGHDFWLGVDRVFMWNAKGLIVVKFEGWDESRGVAEEVGFFTGARKPIYYVEPFRMPDFPDTIGDIY